MTERDERRFSGAISGKTQRGAALVLEIIVYLVVVALIVVLVISGHRAFRQLTYVMHAKKDAQTVQEWTMSQYNYNGIYPDRVVTSLDVKLTVAEDNVNDAEVQATQGVSGGYCVLITSKNISDPMKNKFWINSDKPSTIVQSQSAVDLPCLPRIPKTNVDPTEKKFPVCHEGNMLSLPIEGIVNGHDGHGGDIIPPIPVENFPGKGWNEDGAKKFAECTGTDYSGM